MKNINEETFKPTLGNNPTPHGKKFEKNFKSTMNKFHVSSINEVDNLLTEKEQSLKKKIFSLAKMEALVFSDPRLTAVYNDMAENGEEKYGYHYNETIQNMIFNDYVLNSPKYLQKYKMAIPKEKKRRDKSGINQLKKTGEESMKYKSDVQQQPVTQPQPQQPVKEVDEHLTKVMFLVNEKDPKNPDVFAYFPEETHNGIYKSGYSHIGQHSSVHPEYARESRPATPDEYQDLKTELENIGYNLDVVTSINETTTAGSAGGSAGYVGYAGPKAWSKTGKPMINKPIWKGGTVIGESNYLTETDGFEKYVNLLEDFSNKINDINDFIIDKTTAFTSDAVKGWNGEDKNIELDTINTGEPDKPNLNTMEENIQNKKITTLEELKAYVAEKKARGERGLMKVDIPLLAGQALYKVAVSTANRLLPVSWDELPDTNSMWNYIDENGGMTYEHFIEAVKEACDDRLSEEGFTLDDLNEVAKSKSQQRLFGMAHAVQKGELNPNKVSGAVKKIAKTVSPEDVEDFASTKHKDIPEKVKKNENMIRETEQSMIDDKQNSMSNKSTPVGTQSSGVQMGMQSTSGLKESYESLLEEINNELNAFSIHHDKLKRMAEDRKPSALVLRDRVGSENEKNFKKDLQHSGTKEIIDVEKELQWKDQQTEVGKDPQNLGDDIEKQELKATKGESFENVGDSDNYEGNEIPKRNLTKEEQDEVNMYRLGQQDLVYDNEPSEKFEKRMKTDLGEKLYKQRQDKLEFRSKAPMYNKDAQPTEKAIEKNQFDKEKSGWNEREGLKESMVTGRYQNALNKRRLIDFTLDEVKIIETPKDELFELDFTGLGNTYSSKTIDNKVIVNETVVNVINTHKFYTNGKDVFATKNPVQKLTENEQKIEKPVINEQVDKMKHLLGYQPNSFVDTNNIKKNRGF